MPYSEEVMEFHRYTPGVPEAKEWHEVLDKYMNYVQNMEKDPTKHSTGPNRWVVDLVWIVCMLEGKIVDRGTAQKLLKAVKSIQVVTGWRTKKRVMSNLPCAGESDVLGPDAMGQFVEDRGVDQGQRRGQRQPADDGDGQRTLELLAAAQPDGHGEHGQHRGDAGHDDGTQAQRAGLQHRGATGDAFLAQSANGVDLHDRVVDAGADDRSIAS